MNHHPLHLDAHYAEHVEKDFYPPLREFATSGPLVALVLVNANQNFPFGGTSLLIVVGVGLDTIKQIDAQLQQRHYEGLLR